MPAALREVTFQRLGAGLTYLRSLDLGRASAVALIRLTQLGEYDASVRLVELFLEGRPLQDIPATWVGDIISADDALKERVLEAARSGHEEAEEALAWAEHEGQDDARLRAVADEQVGRFAAAVTREETVEGTRREVRHRMGIRLELGGLLARYAEESTRVQLAQRMREIALDQADTESSRSSAINALFNMAGQLDAEVRPTVIAEIRPLAFGEYEPNPLESDEVDPLSRFQMRYDVAGSLRGSAIGLAARLASLGSDVDYLQEAVNQALVHSTARVRAAGLDALARVPALEAPANLSLALADPDDGVARQAVKALAAHQPDWLTGNLSAIAQHHSYAVRMLAITILEENGHAPALEVVAGADPNAYLRGLAARAREALPDVQSPENPS